MNRKSKKQAFDPGNAESPQVFAVEMESGKAKFTRRDFLKAAGVATAATVAGCAPTPSSTEPPSPQSTLSSQERITACRDVNAHTAEILGLAISQDGTTLLSGSADGSIKIWSLPNGALLNTLEEITHVDGLLAISPDGRFLASESLGVETTIEIWSLPDGVHLKTLRGIPDIISNLTFSPDGKVLALDSFGPIQLWSLPDGNLLNTLEKAGVAYTLAISPDGKLMASPSGPYEEAIQLWSLPDGMQLKTLQGHTDEVLNLTISQDGSLLASNSKDRTVKLWSLPDGELLKTLGGDVAVGTVTALAISPDGKLLATSSYTDISSRNTLMLWSLPDGVLLNSMEGYIDEVKVLVISPDGGLLASASNDGTIKLWSLPGGELVGCAFDLAASSSYTQGVTYETTVSGKTVEVTLPCGAPIPAGAVCTCNCVGGSLCSCDGHSGGGGSHYWHPN